MQEYSRKNTPKGIIVPNLGAAQLLGNTLFKTNHLPIAVPT